MDALNPMAELPMGLHMALTHDQTAMQRFSSLSPDAQRALIDQNGTPSPQGWGRSYLFGRGQDITPQDLAP